MLVMGGIIGSGIFVNPAEVARHVGSPALIVGVWLLGGLIAIAGAFVYAELAARRPEVGGQYAYLRDAWGPMPAFLYGWSLLLVIQSGGMAAVAITFARYLLDIIDLGLPDWSVAAGALALLTAINCLGVRAGGTVQSVLMVLKIGAILMLVICGLWLAPAAVPTPRAAAETLTGLAAIGAALTPVMFSYGGWQTASFVAGEMRDPRRDLARGLMFGVLGVVALYALVALTCVVVLGAEGLAESPTPATAVMRLALGPTGGTLIALGISISALGFLSQGMLTTPRVYFAMAEDRLFFRGLATVNARTHAPIAAILLQGVVACLIAVTGSYGHILSYVVSVDFIWFGMTGAALFVFRRRQRESDGFRAPLHPWTTGFFVLACAVTVAGTIWNHPVNSLIGFAILLTGVPVCMLWLRRRRVAG
jgi:APA family basic amino acid/polyamine antiporter